MSEAAADRIRSLVEADPVVLVEIAGAIANEGRMPPDAITRVAQELRSQYLIGFAPVALDNRVHKLEVKVNKPGMTVRARKSYLAAPDKPQSSAD